MNGVYHTIFKKIKDFIFSLGNFVTSKSEVNEFFVSIGQLTIADDFLQVVNYPFEPSIAFTQSKFKVAQIDDVDCKSCPPSFRVGSELIFFKAESKDELQNFAKKNNIMIVERPMIWTWILEPFLDTEFSQETDQKLMMLLNKYGLTTDQVMLLRDEVGSQMIKYNFDTMLWEWCGFDASDVLRAMRVKYNKVRFDDFYKRVMEIALLAEVSNL